MQEAPLEEKIYFKPEDYGKKKEKSEKKNRKGLKLTIFLIFIAIIVIVILWLLRGKMTTSGQYPANIRNESLTCEATNIVYEKVNNVDSDDKEFKISMVFNGTDSLNSASIKYTLRYGTDIEAHNAAAIAHAQFNIGLQSLGYDSGKFNNKFSEIGNELVITLNLSSKTDINETAASYFLLISKSNGTYPKTLSEYHQNYESQGFICSSTIDNN